MSMISNLLIKYTADTYLASEKGGKNTNTTIEATLAIVKAKIGIVTFILDS